MFSHSSYSDIFENKGGLELPFTAKVAKVLRTYGVDFSSDLTDEGFLTALERYVGGGENA